MTSGFNNKHWTRMWPSFGPQLMTSGFSPSWGLLRHVLERIAQEAASAVDETGVENDLIARQLVRKDIGIG